MNQLQKKQEELESLNKDFDSNNNIQLILAVAAGHVGTDALSLNLKDMYQSLQDAFPKESYPGIKEEYIIQAVKNGMYGEYGKTFKLTVQEVCIWVRKYYETTPEYKQKIKELESQKM